MAIVNLKTFEQFAENEAIDIDLEHTPQTVRNGDTFLFQVRIDNTANSAKTYVRLFDVASGSVTNGTTDPDFILPCAASSVAEYNFFPGAFFDTELSATASTSAGTSGTGAPSSSCIVRFLYGSSDNDV
tara:strand:+ start:11712 stop:12098 length:387 start_codon:yes stop_codon:yes gene_type:complete